MAIWAARRANFLGTPSHRPSRNSLHPKPRASPAGQQFTAEAMSCFPAGTLVATSDGLRPIESIVAGQRVWAFDLIASQWLLRHVLRAHSRHYEGNAASVTVAGETIDSTSRHPYFVVRGQDLEDRPTLEHLARVPDGATTPGRWVDAADLRVGDELLLRDGRIEPIEHSWVYPFFDKVYNFEVDDLHCYAVGCSGILVHNNSGEQGVGDVAPNTARLTQRADEIQSVLDHPAARNGRTTAVLETSGDDVVGGGVRDLSPDQRAALKPGEIPAKLPGEHAEITVLDAAQNRGLTPKAIGTSRDFCPDCIDALQKARARITGPRTAVWD